MQPQDQVWDESWLGARVRELPADGPARRAALSELVKFDLRMQWERPQGQKQTLENYLLAFPELGTAETVSVDLILTELQARQRAGDTLSFTDLRKRFPRQMEQLERGTASPGRDGKTAVYLSGGNTVQPLESAPDLDQQRELARVKLGGGRYEILKELGRGAMGTVYLAKDTRLGRQVALKIPHFGSDKDPDSLARFYREAQSAATLDHPNICPVYDVGEASGIPYLTMAYIEGMSLTDVLYHERTMAPRRAVEIVARLARALEEAHRCGIIHRDLKPSNIMMNWRGEPIIMDFGLARQINQDARLTREGSLLGTPAYMSFEQVAGEGREVGPASDQYSLGVILYEMLTGQLPFQGSMSQVMIRILTKKPTRPRELRPDLDARVEAICLKAMSTDVTDRFPSVADFAAALEKWLRSTPAGEKVAPERVSRSSPPPPTSPPAAPGIADIAATLTGIFTPGEPSSPKTEKRGSKIEDRNSPSGQSVDPRFSTLPPGPSGKAGDDASRPRAPTMATCSVCGGAIAATEPTCPFCGKSNPEFSVASGDADGDWMLLTDEASLPAPMPTPVPVQPIPIQPIPVQAIPPVWTPPPPVAEAPAEDWLLLDSEPSAPAPPAPEQAALPLNPFELEPIPAILPPTPSLPSDPMQTDADVELGPLNFSEPELSLPAATPIPSVPRPEVPAAPAALACPACGRSYGPEHRDAFCVCGAELTPAPVAVAPQPLPVKLPPTPERPSAGTPCLVLYGPDKRPVHYFPLTKDVLLIGRLDPVRGCFPDVDLSEWVDEATARKVSRRHALILRSRATNGFSLRPLPGNTGTQVNTNLLSAPEDVPLTAGTRIILGGTVRFKFETA